MRNIIVVFILVVCVGMSACRDNKIEECEQLYDKYGVSQLLIDEYNSCQDVYLNYVFAVRGNPDIYQEQYHNPYASRVGDTVKISGFIRHSYGEPFIFIDNKWQCLLIDDSVKANNPDDNVGGGLTVWGDDKLVLETFDDTKQCFITAIVTYSGEPAPIVFKIADPGMCYYLEPVCHVLSIHN